MTTDVKGAKCDCCGDALRPAEVTHDGDRRWCSLCAQRADREECAADFDHMELYERMGDADD